MSTLLVFDRHNLFFSSGNDTDSMKSDSSSFEYIVGFPINHLEEKELTLFVTTVEKDPVPFVVETMHGIVFTGNATNISTTIVRLNNSYQVQDSSERNEGIRIYVGSKRITVYGLNYEYTTSDAFLALPCSTQRLDEYVYYGITYDRFRNYRSQLLFIACEDSTTIKIGAQTIFLNKMETYLYSDINDLTGTIAISNNPVSFFSGHQCTNVPTHITYCDHLIQQLPDKSTWGTHFFPLHLLVEILVRYIVYWLLSHQPL